MAFSAVDNDGQIAAILMALNGPAGRNSSVSRFVRAALSQACYVAHFIWGIGPDRFQFCWELGGTWCPVQ
jgi:hypothetical protein